MKPVLSGWPQKKRTVWFGPIAAIVFFVSFLVVAFATQNFLLALLIPPALGIGAAYLLVGWPSVARKDGTPYVAKHHRPYLFFVIAPALALVLYPILGIVLTQAGLPIKLLAPLSILLSLGIGITAAAFLVGVPNVYAAARARYDRIEPARRPMLFYPIFAALFLVITLILGVISTQLLDSVSGGSPEALLNIQLLVVLPIAAILAGVIAWLLVGIPKPTKSPAAYIPKVPGKHRRRAFILTTLLVGIPFTLVVGAILTYSTALPSTAILGLAIVLGYAMSLGIAVLALGTPRRWRTFEDYEPGLDPRFRPPLFIGVSVFVGLLVAVGFGLADVDLFWGLLAGAIAAGVVLLLLTGTHKRIAARRSEATLVPDVPDAMKSMIFFPAWLVSSTVLFAIMSYTFTSLVAVNALVSFAVGLFATFLVLEQPLLHDLREERRRERAKRKEWEARRKERLAAEAERRSQPPDA